MKTQLLILAAIGTLALAGCKKAETPATDAPAATPAAAPAAAAAEVTPAPATDTVKAGTGVPECDQYLEKVYACISDKVPEAQRDMMKQGIEQSRSAWAGVTDKTELANQCKTALEQAKTSFGAMGCSF
ncbi:MAG TPA: hypothetical protein VF513_01395 [Stenotrophomonas sp.]|uniref:hypothetical protein n=1 Tax=Stenotrophomonas pigmentata TaxID=3055080 RepID=UPI0026F37404|nr:hypothetical protein [Stenotrophomonas sp. 610A2]